jgi:DNA-binding NarL/FixJ family response regulator
MRTLNAFLVEDSPAIRENLVGTLEELTPVRFVANAQDERSAVAWLTRNPERCDVIIIDIFLKSGSGLGVLRAAGDLAKPMTLIVLSNYATPDMRRRCLELGANQVFDKSNEIDELIGYCARLAA